MRSRWPTPSENADFDWFRQSLARWWRSNLLIVPTVKDLKFQKSKMVAAAILLNPKSKYIYNGLTDNHEHLHGNAIRQLWCVPQLEICNFKNPKWRLPPFWKIGKIAIFRPLFQRFQQNLAGWRSSARLTVWSVTNLKFKKSQTAAAGWHLKN